MAGTLEQLGYTDWFRHKYETRVSAGLAVARVTAVHKDSYTVSNGAAETLAEVTGKLMHTADSPLALPTVGDWVQVQYMDEGAFAVIHGVLPRKSLLKRKTSGKRVDFQLIAANIDTALVVQSLDGNYNLNRLERYLVMAYEGGIEPVAALSKSDLLPEAEIEVKCRQIERQMPGLRCVPFSNKTGRGLDQLQACLRPGQTFCLLGSSGVGKTTLLNSLLGTATFLTRDVRAKDRKGRHTTTRRQLALLPGGALAIDTPGMRELGNLDSDSGMAETFSDIAALSAKCRFADCGHTHEKGCAVLAAVQSEAIAPQRYENWLKMSRETAFYEMSYREKKKRDKQFGKMVKSVMKHKMERRDSSR